MILVFRSLVVLLIASAASCLVGAAMGAVVAIYQWGWLGDIFMVHSPSPVLSFLPTIMIGVLFGLAMDYQLFISSVCARPLPTEPKPGWPYNKALCRTLCGGGRGHHYGFGLWWLHLR